MGATGRGAAFAMLAAESAEARRKARKTTRIEERPTEKTSLVGMRPRVGGIVAPTAGKSCLYGPLAASIAHGECDESTKFHDEQRRGADRLALQWRRTSFDCELRMIRATWPSSKLDLRQAFRLTLAFWAFTFVVFQAPALKTGRLTVWETTGFAVIVSIGVAFSIILYGLIRWSQRFDLRTRIGCIAVGAVAAAVAHSIIDHLTFVAFATLFDIPAQIPPLLTGFIFNILIYIWVYGLYVTVVGLIITTNLVHEQERRLAAATAAAQEAQLTALRFQINPHFLFNSLNAVTSLIGSGRNVEAETVVMRLSDFFRASLTSAPGDLVVLEEEFDVIGSYLDIEAARFGDRMIVDIDLPDGLRTALTPHFLLQPLAENAVKHGVARSKHPVTVSIRAQVRDKQLHLSVSNDAGGGTLLEPAANGTGVGLSNVSQRLQALFGVAGELRTFTHGQTFTAEIVMPLKLEGDMGQAAA